MSNKFKVSFDANGSEVEDSADTSGKGLFGYPEGIIETAADQLGIPQSDMNEYRAADTLVSKFPGEGHFNTEFTNREIGVVLALSYKSVIQAWKQSLEEASTLAEAREEFIDSVIRLTVEFNTTIEKLVK